MNRLHVCVHATVLSGEGSGVERYTLALAKALLALEGETERYSFLIRDDCVDVVRGELGSGTALLQTRMARGSARSAWLKKVLPRTVAAAKKYRDRHRRWVFAPERSDGLIERAGVELVHFPTQAAFLTELRNIFQPHDLQHRHLPQYFGRRTLAYREAVYPAYCGQADAVAVVSSWVKEDVVRAFGLPAEKVIVVPYAAPSATPERKEEVDVAAIFRPYDVPSEFLFYPAQTFPHKNHLRLLEALACLKREGVEVPLVLCGAPGEYAAAVEAQIRTLGLRGQVRSLGCVGAHVVDALWSKARAAVVPSEFEVASFPAWEAFANQVPLACSNVTSLPRQVGDAAVLFSPTDVTGMAEAIRKVWTDTALRAKLTRKGRARIEGLSWSRTAKIFRATYRRICRRALTDEDRGLLSEPSRL